MQTIDLMKPAGIHPLRFLKSIALLVVAGICGSLTPTVGAADVTVRITSDFQVRPAGKQTNPVAAADALDAFLRQTIDTPTASPEDSLIIEFDAGIFYTRGGWDPVSGLADADGDGLTDRGFRLRRDRLTFRGRGDRGAATTTLKLVDVGNQYTRTSERNPAIRSEVSRTTVVTTGIHSPVHHLTVEGFIIDCNYPELQQPGLFQHIAGVQLWGEDLNVRNVTVLHAVSHRDRAPAWDYAGSGPVSGTGDENFIIYLKGSDRTGDKLARCTVTDCRVQEFSGGYCSAITIAGIRTGGPEKLSQATGMVRNCEIDLNYTDPQRQDADPENSESRTFGLNASGHTVDVLFEGNRVRNAGRGFNNDTGPNIGVQLRNNIFENVTRGMIIQASEQGLAENNTIRLFPGVRSIGIFMAPHVDDIIPYGAEAWRFVGNKIHGNYSGAGPSNDYGFSLGFYTARPGRREADCETYWPRHCVLANNMLIGESAELDNVVTPYFNNILQPGNLTGKRQPAPGRPQRYLAGFPTDEQVLFAPSRGLLAGRFITRVELTEIETGRSVLASATPEAGDGYFRFNDSFQAEKYPLYRNQRYTLRMTSSSIQTSEPAGWGAWIDWNQNGRLEDSERLPEPQPGKAPGEVWVDFEVPSRSTVGGATWMRVILSQPAAPESPDHPYYVGEVEDYFFKVHFRPPGAE